jgi:hypothetical protein
VNPEPRAVIYVVNFPDLIERVIWPFKTWMLYSESLCDQGNASVMPANKNSFLSILISTAFHDFSR